MAGQVGAGDEAYVAVGDRDLGVNPPVRKRGRSFAPSVELRGRNQHPHLADHVERDASSVILRRFEQHRDAHPAHACVVQCLHDGRDVIGHEAGDEQAWRKAFVLSPARERRQRVRRVAVPHRQVPPGVPGRRIPGSGCCSPVGHAVRVLVQPGAPAQQDPIRRPGVAARRPGRGDPGRTTRSLPASSQPQPGTLVAPDAGLVAGGARGPQPGGRRHRRPSRNQGA